MKILVLSLLVLAALCNLRLNAVYRDVLKGREPLTLLKAKEIYQSFQSQYPKDAYRFGIFFRTLKEIVIHNTKDLTWTQGINDFSDMTWEEFKGVKLMEPQNCSATNSFKIEKSNVKVPTAFQWNDFGVVTPVKNQASCGSCWAFSTVGALEAHWNIQGKGKNVLFAEQQLVDCAGAFDNHGCAGGLPSQAFEYIRHAGGIMGPQSYPYVGKDGNCTFDFDKVVGHVRYGSYNITAGDEDELADRLYNVGPISIAYQVVSDFKNYHEGVYVPTVPCGTGPDDVNHAVVATGYGLFQGQPFWNVKNSWGSTWGHNGYFMISRGNNTCAVSQCNSYPLIDRPNISNLRQD